MGWWKADPVPDPEAPRPTPQPQQPPPPASDSSCPVDEKTRSIWLQQAQTRSQRTPNLPSSHPPIPTQSKSPPPPPPPPPQQPLEGSSRECSSDRISQSPLPPPIHPTHKPSRQLSQEREISSIPRTLPTPSQSSPANAEAETGPHTSGNWIYPSESQFYSAVMSKQTSSSPDALLSSISHIIPIHNAVNERAWTLISQWEKPYSTTITTTTATPGAGAKGKRGSGPTCTGPKLHSFSGRGAGALSPKAKWNTWILGYTEPFDRHDWVVERCDGSRVEYLIDFYQGKAPENNGGSGGERGRGRGGENLNFYLDVRPKLNTFEGWRMRGEKMMGLK